MLRPYYNDGGIWLYHGDCRDVLNDLPTIHVDAAIVDPPYGETDLEWDVWLKNWPALIARSTRQMWCFGSLRMFIEHAPDFEPWKLAQDVVWEKHNGSGLHADRFRRVHELAVHWYRGPWEDLYVNPPVITVQEERKRATALRTRKPAHFGAVGEGRYEYNGKRLMRSVIAVKSCHMDAVNETQKPEGIVWPLLEYSVPAGGLVLDPCAGSGTVLVVARKQGKKAIGIEKRESQCEEIALRLSQKELAI